MPTVTSANREEFIRKEMAKKSGTPMSARTAPIHMGNWMKKYKEYEDKNYHSENVVRLANLVGHHEHHQEAMDIMKRHHERGHLDEKDSKRRNEIDREHYPKAVSMHEEWQKRNK
jgi:hypothetical protein